MYFSINVVYYFCEDFEERENEIKIVKWKDFKF